MTRFLKLNADWNAEPNAPDPGVSVHAGRVVLEFLLNPHVFRRFRPGQRGRLVFSGARRYRLGITNDEGWYRGQCRFSGKAPEWGEFYEISGDPLLDASPEDWVDLGPEETPPRHFLFYLRDHTFECRANDWRFETEA